MHIYFWIIIFIFFGQIPRSGIAGLYGSSFLNFLRNLHSVFHSDCTNLYYHLQYTTVLFSPHPWQYLLFVVFLMIVILRGWRYSLVLVLICVSLMISTGEHLFICVCFPSECVLKKNKFLGLLFLIGFLFFYIEFCEFFILHVNLLSGISLANIFSHLVGCLLI